MIADLPPVLGIIHMAAPASSATARARAACALAVAATLLAACAQAPPAAPPPPERGAPPAKDLGNGNGRAEKPDKAEKSDQADEPRKYRPLKAYAGDPFVPVNLFMNPDERVRIQHAELLEHAAALLTQSGAFVRVERGVLRWPVTLQLRYHAALAGGAGDGALRVVNALTLGLLPVKVRKSHQLLAEVFVEPDPVANLNYQEDAADTISLFELGDRLREERPAVERLLERLLADIAAKKLVPRFSAYKATPPPEPPGKPPSKSPRKNPGERAA